MQEVKCIICKDKQRLEVLYQNNFSPDRITPQTFSARRTPDRIHYRIVKCRRCGLLFSNPILEEDKINKLYKKSDFTFPLEAEYLKKTYWNYFEDLLPKENKEKISVLEVGCSSGFFLEEIYKRGVTNISGIEPGKESVAKAPKWLRNRIKIDVFKHGLFKKGSFDIICCFHTLDHVLKPNEFVRDTYRLLKNAGKVLFVAHNTDGLSVKIFGEHSPIFDIEHIYLFNPNTLLKLLEMNGFKDIKIIDIKNKYPLSYWARLMPFPKFLKDPLIYFLNISKIGFIPVAISAGNIGIIAEK